MSIHKAAGVEVFIYGNQYKSAGVELFIYGDLYKATGVRVFNMEININLLVY